MANAGAVMNSFKQELFNAVHAFGSPPAHTAATPDVIKCALIGLSGSIGASTTVWASSGINEVSSAGYTNGGLAVATWSAALSGTTACITPSASLVWTSVTFTTDCALFYNSSQGNKAIASYALGTIGTGQVVAGNFTLTMPANAAGSALLQIA